MAGRSPQDPTSPSPLDPSRLPWPQTTERLLVRPCEEGDVPAVHAYRSQPDVVRYLGHVPLDLAAVAELLRERRRPDGSPVLHLAALDRATGELVGDGVVGTRDSSVLPGGPPDVPAPQGWLGYCVAPEHTGRGVATELTTAMLGILFDGVGVRRVVANVFSEHEASRRVLAKAGLRREARFVAAVRDGDGRWIDDDAYALLADEWVARHRPGRR